MTAAKRQVDFTPRQPFKIPPIWSGETAYIIGGGPSLKDQDLSPLQDQRTIGVNVAFRYYPWVDVVYFGDCSLYSAIRKDLLEYKGLKISSCGRVPDHGWPGVKRVTRGKPSGLESSRRDRISWNGNSGSSAINIAFWFGVKRIVLLGFDMRIVDKNKNFHSDYGYEDPLHHPFKRYLRHFDKIAEDAKALGIEILNCSPVSLIEQFQKVKLEDTL